MKNYFFVILLIISIITSCYRRSKSNNDSVKEVMDDIVTRLYQTLSSEQLDTIGSSYILNNITGKEKLVLATKYWYFNVNIPVTVSLMRDMDQENAPFWLKTIGMSTVLQLILIIFNPAPAILIRSDQNMEPGLISHHSIQKQIVMIAFHLSGLGIHIIHLNSES